MNLINIAEGLCTSESGYRIFGIAGYALQFIQIGVPIILIVMGAIDLVKAMMAQSDDKMKKAQSLLIKRAITGVIIFFVPMLVKFAMGMLNESMNNDCVTSFFNPKEAVNKANELKSSLTGSLDGSKIEISPDAEILTDNQCKSRNNNFYITTDPIKINFNKTNCVPVSIETPGSEI